MSRGRERRGSLSATPSYRGSDQSSRASSFESPIPQDRPNTSREPVDGFLHKGRMFHADLPLPTGPGIGTAAAVPILPFHSGNRPKVERAEQADEKHPVACGLKIAGLFFYVIPNAIYLGFLLGLPALYWSRVTRIFEEADLGIKEIKEIALTAVASRNKALIEQLNQGIIPSDLPANRYKSLIKSWEEFIERLTKEYEVLNVITVLLLSYVLLFSLELAFHNTTQNYLHRAPIAMYCG